MDSQTVIGMILFAAGSLSMVFHEKSRWIVTWWDDLWGIDRGEEYYQISFWLSGAVITILGFALMFDLL